MKQMNKIETRKTRLSDIHALYRGAVDKSIHDDEELFKDWAITNVQRSTAFTCLHNGEPLACAGIRFLPPAPVINAEVWAVFSVKAKKYIRYILRDLKEELNIFVNKYKVENVYADSRIGFPKSQRLLEHLGFKKLDITHNGYLRYKLTVKE